MSMRSTFGILALMGLLASSSASVLTYRVTGAFDEGYDDYEALVGTSFTYDFSYDTEATNYGDESGAAYELASTNLETAMGSVGGWGGASIDLDPEYGSMFFGATEFDEDGGMQNYGIAYTDLPPLSADLPTDLVRFSSNHTPSFFLSGSGSVGTFAGVGFASASKVSVQAVPEPASMAVLAIGAVGLARRRRRRG